MGSNPTPSASGPASPARLTRSSSSHRRVLHPPTPTRLRRAAVLSPQGGTIGGMAERTKATVLKTVEPFSGSVGSNPTPSAIGPTSSASTKYRVLSTETPDSPPGRGEATAGRRPGVGGRALRARGSSLCELHTDLRSKYASSRRSHRYAASRSGSAVGNGSATLAPLSVRWAIVTIATPPRISGNARKTGPVTVSAPIVTPSNTATAGLT